MGVRSGVVHRKRHGAVPSLLPTSSICRPSVQSSNFLGKGSRQSGWPAGAKGT